MKPGFVQRARSLAASTPAERDRTIDALRAWSILVVVFGHWLMAAPEVLADGTLRAGHALVEIPWTRWLTWLFQVMPVFFFVGGFSNLRSWRSSLRRGVAPGTWMRDRLRRLLLPVLPLVAIWTVGAVSWRMAGADPELLRTGSQAALVPVWFLATYVVVTILTPVTARLWDRFGWSTAVLGTVIAAGIDAVTIGGGPEWPGWLNYLFVWNTVHVLGFALADRRSPPAGPTAIVGFGALLALVTFAPYPISMVGLDGAAVTNTTPPRVTLVALAVGQFGLALAIRPLLARTLSRERAWTWVVAVNGSIMTLYLWHLTAMIALAGVLLAAGGAGLGIPIGTAAWWSTRPLWLGVCTAATVPFLLAMGRFERPRRDDRPPPPWWRPATGTVLSTLGLALLALHGISGEDGLHWWGIVLPPLGALVGGAVRPPPVRSGAVAGSR